MQTVAGTAYALTSEVDPRPWVSPAINNGKEKNASNAEILETAEVSG